MQIEGGSQNLSRLPGLYVYPAPRYSPTPVEAVERLRAREPQRDLGSGWEQPDLYSPQGRQNPNLLTGANLDLLA